MSELRMSLSTTNLNADVLLHIMHFSDTPTICQLMRTSREFYHHAPKLLLPSLLALELESELESFIQFMSAEAPYRFQFLQGLSISTGALSEPVSELLVDFLLRFGSFVKLEFCHIGDAEAFFDSHPVLAEAFASLASIKELELVGAGPTTRAMLRASQSTLKRAALALTKPLPVDEDDDDDDDGTEGGDGAVLAELEARDYQSDNPLYLLHNSEATLDDLTIEWCVIACPDDVLYTPQYPHLTTLNLFNTELPQIHHYARAFPNLKSLLVKIEPEEVERLRASPEERDLHRARNEVSQLRHGTWTALECVGGTLLDVYLLGLLCPVKQLTIGAMTGHLDAPMFHAIMQSMQPACVYFEMVDACAFGPFRAAMSDPSVACIQSLQVSLAPALLLHPSEVDIAWSLGMLIQSIAGCSIHTLGLSICCTALSFPLLGPYGRREVRNMPSFFPPARSAWPAEQELAALDFEDLARRIQAAAPSIRTIVFTIVGHKSRPDETLVVGEDAVETFPLQLAVHLRKQWTEAVENCRVVSAMSARYLATLLGKEILGL